MKVGKEYKRISDVSRGYFKMVGENYNALAWACKEFIPDESKRMVKSLVLLVVSLFIIKLANPWVIKFIVRGIVARDMSLVNLGLYICAAEFILSWILGFCLSIKRDKFVRANRLNLYVKVVEKFLNIDLLKHKSDYERLNHSRIKGYLGNVLGVEQYLLFEGVEGLLGLITNFSILCIICCYSNSFNVIVFLFLILNMHFFWFIYNNHQTVNKLKAIKNEEGNFKRYLSERMEYVFRVKASVKESYEISVIGKMASSLKEKSGGYWERYITFRSFGGLITGVVCIYLLKDLVYKVAGEQIDLDDFLLINSYIGLVIFNINQITKIERRVNDAMPDLLLLREALEQESEKVFQETSRLGDISSIEFKDVCFSYPHRESQKDASVLRNADFSLARGENLIIAGPNGVGKSTLLSLLNRGYMATSGSLLFNDKSIRDYSLMDIRRALLPVGSDSEIFSGSLKDNLTYSLAKEEHAATTDSQIRYYLNLLGLNEKKGFRYSLDHIIDTRSISDGQKQLLRIVEVLLRKPQVVILDEALGKIDPGRVRKIFELLETELEESIIVFVTHHLITLKGLKGEKKIIMLEPSEEGSRITAITEDFETLMQKSSVFREMAKDQGIS